MLKKNRAASVIGLAAVASLTLAACSEEGGESASNVEGLTDVTGELQGEGATSQQRAMDLFATKFEETGSTLSYNANGSGSGQTQFIAGTVAFAGSDSPLKEDKDGKNQIAEAKERCGGNDAWHLPMVIGPVAVAYNLEGVELTLTPALVAEIFDGKITKWNDPKIAEVNKDAKLPDKDIKVVYRSEESGTTDNFMKFLSASAPDQWKHEASKSFPTATGQGANGSSGVVNEVSNIDGAITYVEAGFAKDKGLGISKMDFGHGPVELNKDTVGKALDSVKFKTEGNDMVVDSDALFSMDEAGAYPLVLTTYEIVCSAGYDEQTRDLVKNFLKVVLEEGQGQELEDLGYIPVQGEFKDKLSAAVDAIK
ncbi:MAG: phosphate ABC transporter substrate-binding protein PstS [Corynebacterium sp.]|uniref:phosphate ABC transporter substrate-binding protein PstS n=1 Tax=Corynebacterium sp. TaxID=1720 RepID=UPI0026DDCB7A|nr:phosphate ABC transporter substrate-binding protein PstS [Corynebacterium sp.]MDO5030677.1 phosphate ABC transporter substrate-binding protein PstS [Corynebacterium sp.]